MSIYSRLNNLLVLASIFLSFEVVGYASEPSSSESQDESEQQMMGPNTLWQNSGDCGEMGVWDVSMVMCMPLASPEMPMSMFMVHGNLYGNRVWQSGPRGRSDFYSTNMIMLDGGRSFLGTHYLNLDVMLTSELWTVPAQGYPLLLQIGEVDRLGRPFRDAQHPHSSPLMGVTLSDTIRLGESRDLIKIFFAPRGEVTDGPLAFMHRLTGIVNPNAPLGHHIGQDVGHISSTVIGASLKQSGHRFEFSIFSGVEPKPTQVDLPLNRPDSFAFRYVREFSPQLMAMTSFARLGSKHEGTQEGLSQHRYSLSFYQEVELNQVWKLYHTFIYGGISHLDGTPFLSSFLDEILVKNQVHRFWGRLEILQRTPAQLQLLDQFDSPRRQWVTALTLGYSRRMLEWQGVELMIGGLITQNFIPQNFNPAYQSHPWSGQVFLQLGGMQMWNL